MAQWTKCLTKDREVDGSSLAGVKFFNFLKKLRSSIFPNKFEIAYIWIQNQLKFIHGKFLIRLFHQIPIGGLSLDHRRFIEEFNFSMKRIQRVEFSS